MPPSIKRSTTTAKEKVMVSKLSKYNIVDGSRKLKRSAEKEVLTWIRKRTYPYQYGWSWADKTVFRQITNKQVINAFRACRTRDRRIDFPRIDDRMYAEHMAGERIFYFYGDGRIKTPETLLKIDVDCHKSGSFAGAVSCVEWLTENGFPGLFWSRSTNGRGAHAYIVVDKFDVGVQAVLDGANGLEKWLKYQHSVHGWDIEMIEVKGKPRTFHWGEAKYDLLDITGGSLAKIPVEAFDRPHDLMNTTRLKVKDLRRLGSQVPRDWESSTPTPTPTPTSAEFGSIDMEEMGASWRPSHRHREWPLWVEHVARHGLQEGDDLGVIVGELAAWLWWVELYSDRDEKIIADLLFAWVQERHNGHVERLNEGKVADVESQVKRAVKSAKKKCAESLEVFAKIRQKRSSGKYRRLIEVAQIMGAEVESTETERDTLSSLCLVLRDDPLPSEIENRLAQIIADLASRKAETPSEIAESIAEFVPKTERKPIRMRKRDGEYPFVRFARRFLNCLWDHHGHCRINTDDLNLMAGSKDAHQQIEYKKYLRDAGIIEPYKGKYRSGTASSLYAMTPETLAEFRSHHRQASQTA
ncbi:hypothetical protein [Tautonia sociabilis]|uniref:Uncharacterized protein n=1 Tax=Tautonia sociabilis TaxID=2080755 RepID=A0A432MKA1_9BACT|nr:hypothetical protein [Tautonia sociabilis]RUL87605.1 hypothetical protein TsocGM_11385 [Tautonia sociabilis]